MVIVGGATRLTDSGLSITEWQPIVGVIPPLSQAEWINAFEKYKQIPEFQTLNRSMTLDEFKLIYWWEWGHRLLGRIIGVVFFIPMIVFTAQRRLSGKLLWQLPLLFLLGAAQGFLGWFMVQSGLKVGLDVSAYRLTAHLLLAVLLYVALIWTVLGIDHNRAWKAQPGALGALILVLLVVLQFASGGFVAGLDAGMGNNTWPTMEGYWIPPGMYAVEPIWRNIFENATTVQFNHRLIAYVIVIVAIVHAWRTFSISGAILAYVTIVQISIGVFTLLSRVPVSLGIAHQTGALIVLAVAVWHLHRKSTIQSRSVDSPSFA